jgi:outer membrane protein assembly factor BamB
MLLVANVLLALAPAAQAQDRVRWRFRTEGFSIGRFVTVAPDGTVYTSSNTTLYALSPAGDLLWSAPWAGTSRPISLGADGTIYTGGLLIKAINPDGTLKWQFANPRPGLDLAAGPSVGPDGNIYAAQDSTLGEGLGVFSLDPNGNLRWATRSQFPQINLRGPSNTEILFAQDRMYITIFRRVARNPSIRTYDFDGDLIWYSSDLGLAVGSEPTLDPTGRLILRRPDISMQALTPDAQVDWVTTHPNRDNLLVRPAVGSDGRIYTAGWSQMRLWSLNPDGSTRWVLPPSEGTLRSMDITPDDQQLIAGGYSFTTDMGWVRGYTSADGSLQWQVNLPDEVGLNQLTCSQNCAFSPDGSTVYVATCFPGSTQFGYLYAIDLTDGCYADCDQSTGASVLDIFDFLCFQNSFVAGEPYACDCDTSTGPGVCDVFDFLCFQNSFVGGCP